ncbi:MAG: DUF5684 domain-containing protein [Phycisphaerales bacterium]
MDNVIPIVIVLVFLAIAVLVIAGIWKVFEKAGQPGWAAIIPFYNTYVMCKIAGKPWWWLLLCMIPYAGVVFFCIVCVGIAKAFGKDVGFGIGLGLLGVVFFPILGFGKDQYQGPPLPA